MLGLQSERAVAEVPVGAYVDIDVTSDQLGLWLTRDDGTVETRGPAVHYGHRPALDAGERVNGLEAAPSGEGYWLFTDRGRVFGYGDAEHFGDASGFELAGAVIDAAATPTGRGYYLLGADGGIFSFGDAVFYGSVPQVLPGVALDEPLVGMATTVRGYVLVAADGGVFTFGDAAFHGSVPGILGTTQLDRPISGLVSGPGGYLMFAADGGVFSFGQSPFHGSLAGFATSDVVGVTVLDDRSGYLVLDRSGAVWPFGESRSVGVTALEGSGSVTFITNLTANPIVHLQPSDPGVFSVSVLDAGQRRTQLLTRTGPGRGGYRFVTAPQPVFLQVQASGPWRIEIAPATYARIWRPSDGPFDGLGNEVIRVAEQDVGATLNVRVSEAGSTQTTLTANPVGLPTSGDALVMVSGETSDGVWPEVEYPMWSRDSIIDVAASARWSLSLGVRQVISASNSDYCFDASVVNKHSTLIPREDLIALGLADDVTFLNARVVTGYAGITLQGPTLGASVGFDTCPQSPTKVATISSVLSTGERLLVDLIAKPPPRVATTCELEIRGGFLLGVRINGSFTTSAIRELARGETFESASVRDLMPDETLSVTPNRISFNLLVGRSSCPEPGFALAEIEVATSAGRSVSVFPSS